MALAASKYMVMVVKVMVTACRVAVEALVLAFFQSFPPDGAFLGELLSANALTTSVKDETGAVTGRCCFFWREGRRRFIDCGVAGRTNAAGSILQPLAQSASEETPHSMLLVVDGR